MDWHAWVGRKVRTGIMRCARTTLPIGGEGARLFGMNGVRMAGWEGR